MGLALIAAAATYLVRRRRRSESQNQRPEMEANSTSYVDAELAGEPQQNEPAVEMDGTHHNTELDAKEEPAEAPGTQGHVHELGNRS